MKIDPTKTTIHHFPHAFINKRGEAVMIQLLAEKRIYRGRKLLCRIRYADYRGHDGFLHPHAVLLQNRSYNYNLILRLKSVYSLEDLRGDEAAADGCRRPHAAEIISHAKNTNDKYIYSLSHCS